MKQYLPSLALLSVLLASCASGQGQNNGTGMVTVNVTTTHPKMCSCQIVELQLEDYKSERVAIFAEKEQTGKPSNNFRIMNEMIRKEKTYLQRGFVSGVVVLNRFKSFTDCMTLFHKIDQQDSPLRINDILNVDVLLSVARR